MSRPPMLIRPLVGFSKPAIILQSRGFSATRGPEKRNELAGLDLEVEVLYRGISAEVLAHPIEDQKRHQTRPPLFFEPGCRRVR